MKIIFYRSLIGRAKNLTPNERMMYSFLVSKTIAQMGEHFDFEKHLMLNDLYDFLQEKNNRLNVYEISYKKLADELNISFQSAINGYRSLIANKYIVNGEIYISKELIENGYFIIPEIHRLKGEALLFYSFLKDRSRKYDGEIDTYRYKLAELFGVKEPTIKQLLSKLYKFRLIERLNNGKLKIN